MEEKEKENRETWLCRMWLHGQQQHYYYYQGQYQEMEKASGREAAVYELAQAIQGDIEDGAPLETGLYADLLTYAISRIDFTAVAESFAE